MRTVPKARSLAGRLGRSALAGAMVSLLASALDTAWAASGAGPESPGAGNLYLASVGLVAPAALLVAIVAGVSALVVDPVNEPSIRGLLARLRFRAIGHPADVAAFVPLAVIGTFVWATLCAHAGRVLLSLDAPAGVAGASLAAASLALGAFVALAVLALVPALRRALATASERRRWCVDPAATGFVAVGIVALLVLAGVWTGTVSGEGGPLGPYGIFKRPELDLRAAGLFGAIGVVAFFAPERMARVPGVLATVMALSPLILTARAATALGVDPETTQAIERGAPVGRLSLAPLRKLGDRDRDGASGWFGGGDCNDRDPRINPTAREVVDNGVDEDCSGSDLSSKALATQQPVAPTPSAKQSLPPDLSVVWITVDTLRHDLGFAGYERRVSPNLDALAARSTVFERAYALASYTGKCVGPMLIGKYGSETDRNWGHFNKFGDRDTFLAERLKRAGIRTMSVHGHRYFGSFGGLDRGFDVVDLSAAPPEGAKWDVDDTATSGKLTDAALRLLAAPENTSGRFFLWVHYLDPHADYLEHAEVPSFGKSQRDLYDGEVAFTDKHIGRLLEAIQKSPWGSKTAIVVSSDHGEAFGEHKMFRHGFEVWEVLVRVPLVVHVPGAKPSRVAVRRSTIDLVPTTLDLMGLPQPSGAGDDFVSGASLVPDVFADAGASVPSRDVLVDMPAGPYNDSRRALIRGDLKLIVSNESRYELYDLSKDPGETQNLWKKDAAATSTMQEAYAATKARLKEIRVTGQRK